MVAQNKNVFISQEAEDPIFNEDDLKEALNNMPADIDLASEIRY